MADLAEEAQRLGERERIGFILVRDNQDFPTYVKALATKPWKAPAFPRRFVILWQAPPVNPLAVLSWRSGLIEEGKVQDTRYAYRFIQLPLKPGQLEKKLQDWLPKRADTEEIAFTVKERVVFSAPAQAEPLLDGYHPGFLTVSPEGKLAVAFEHLDECKRLYAQAIGSKVDVRREAVLSKLDPLLALSPGTANPKEVIDLKNALQAVVKKPENFFTVDRQCLPKILLLGPSGCGKTLIARYLAWRISPNPGGILSRPLKRIPIPEYLGREEQMEYDLFGYQAGAYTGGSPIGSRGFLLERLGGVVFFDEIGDASPSVQARLLAFLDDYLVVPRGWVGNPIFCPMLVVAATNRPIDRWAAEAEDSPGEEAQTAAGRFRNDLLQRFDTVIALPGLDDRKEELPFILDAMLQMRAFNPGGKIKKVGTRALEKLTEMDFHRGNFRLLERLIRHGCQQAALDGRDWLSEKDWMI